MESGENRLMPIRDRVQARIDYILKPSGPISKEVVLQIRKIQAQIPKGAAWDTFEKIKKETPEKMAAIDAEFRKSSLWNVAQKLIKMTFFFSPLVVLATDGPSPASQERKKIRKSANEWRTYLTKTPEGKKLIGSYQGKDGGRKIEDMIIHIMAGRSPVEAHTPVSAR